MTERTEAKPGPCTCPHPYLELGDLEQLALEGYSPLAPDPTTSEIDRDLCAVSSCNRCGYGGLNYQPFSRAGSYRAFATCPSCSHAEEF